jgi:hypothetical protein
MSDAHGGVTDVSPGEHLPALVERHEYKEDYQRGLNLSPAQ